MYLNESCQSNLLEVIEILHAQFAARSTQFYSKRNHITTSWTPRRLLYLSLISAILTSLAQLCCAEPVERLLPDVCSTGANNGIGYETIVALAEHFANFYLSLGSHSLEKGKLALDEVKK